MGEADEVVGNLWTTFKGMDALDLCRRLNITPSTNKHVALTRVLSALEDQVARIQTLEDALVQEREATVFCPDCRRVVKRTLKLSIHHALQASIGQLEAALLRYGHHERLCHETPRGPSGCACGLDAALPGEVDGE